MNHEQLCSSFGQILSGKAQMENGTCSLTLNRHLSILVNGYPVHNLANVEIWFQSITGSEHAVNFAEIAVLQQEVPPFTSLAVQQNLTISALHNHWLFTSPLLLYLHLQSIEPPLRFAHKMANALKVLSGHLSSS